MFAYDNASKKRRPTLPTRLRRHPVLSPAKILTFLLTNNFFQYYLQ